ncbi:Thiazole synthase [Fusobacterium necrophorum subsp. necrophorum]|nr:Thiazole synthase [Fusobacterium necrophorum subsp. necrophorum]
MDQLKLQGKIFNSRLLTGTGKFRDKKLIEPMLESSESEMITMALRRVNFQNPQENILNYIPKHISLLPNTSGARDAKEAIKIAMIAREAGCGNFIKIEIINDMNYLLPNNEETIKATKFLAEEGFIVLPYMYPDIYAAKALEDAGAAAVMPLGAPIGSNKGLLTKPFLEILNENKRVPLIVDAGIGTPSQAAEAMEMGVDAVLVNTAIATAEDPVMMGKAFSMAVKAGRMAYLAKLASTSKYAQASSPLTDFYFEVTKHELLRRKKEMEFFRLLFLLYTSNRRRCITKY